MPSLLWPQMAYQQFAMSGFNPQQYLYTTNIYLSSQPLDHIVRNIFTRAVERSGEPKPASEAAVGRGTRQRNQHLVHTQPACLPALAAAVMLAKQRDPHNKEFPPIVVELPCALFSIGTATAPAAAVTAKNLR